MKQPKYREYINRVIASISDIQRNHLNENDIDMNRIITTLVNELASNKPPKAPRKLDKFIDAIPYARERAYEYKDTNGLGTIKVTYEPFAANTIKGTKTIREWYDHYLERFEVARLSIQQENDKTRKPKDKPLPDKSKKVDQRPVHDKDVLAYPFKSKL